MSLPQSLEELVMKGEGMKMSWWDLVNVCLAVSILRCARLEWAEGWTGGPVSAYVEGIYTRKTKRRTHKPQAYSTTDDRKLVAGFVNRRTCIRKHLTLQLYSTSCPECSLTQRDLIWKVACMLLMLLEDYMARTKVVLPCVYINRKHVPFWGTGWTGGLRCLKRQAIQRSGLNVLKLNIP